MATSTNVEDLINKALSTDSESEAETCIRMIRKKHKGKKLRDLVSLPSSSSRRITKEQALYVLKHCTIGGKSIYLWKERAEVWEERAWRMRDKVYRLEKQVKRTNAEWPSLAIFLTLLGPIIGIVIGVLIT